jgi:hypothetical protein
MHTSRKELGPVLNVFSLLIETMAKVVAAAIAGASTVDLCKLGDDSIEAAVATVYNKKVEGKAIPKGTIHHHGICAHACWCI